MTVSKHLYRPETPSALTNPRITSYALFSTDSLVATYILAMQGITVAWDVAESSSASRGQRVRGERELEICDVGGGLTHLISYSRFLVLVWWAFYGSVNMVGFGRTDNQEKNEKQSQNNKTGLGMEKTVKDKAKSKPESQSSQKVNRKVNWSKSKSTQVNPGAKVQEK
ncbi:hypothetical protein Tco_0449530 [Tanacetum coccineum]